MLNNCRTNVTDEGQSCHLSTYTSDENAEWVRATVPDNWHTWLSMKWCLICASVVESSKIDLGFTMFVQNGFQNNSQERTSTTIWQSVKACWSAGVTKVMLFFFWDAFSLGMGHGSTIMTQKANKHQSMEWKHITSPVRKKFRTQPSVAEVMLTLLLGEEYTRASFATLPR